MTDRHSTRRLRFEPLESRALLAAGLQHNLQMPNDVDASGQVEPRDALLVIHALNETAVGGSAEGEEPRFVDTTGDGVLTPADALSVINEINAEGEPPPSITAEEVSALLRRAAAASASEDAVMAIVDRAGRVLGVRAEADVLATYAGDEGGLVFAVDGAVAKARTAAFFSSNAAPLTSRTVRFISQSTVTQREVESNPNLLDPDSVIRGPGFVAPIGVGGHFPPEIPFTPQVDLFAIEHQSRDSRRHPGLDGVKGTADDRLLENRFGVDDAHLADGVELTFPESYGVQSGRLPLATSRGIATLPGGIPLFKAGRLVGGIGVFFPGPDGFATHEQGFVHADDRGGVAQTEASRTNAARVLESEWIAFAAAGGSAGAPGGASVGTLGGVAPVAGFDLPFGRIDLVGITLEIYGPHPTRANRRMGFERLLDVGTAVGPGDAASGADQFVDPGADGDPATAGDNLLYLEGRDVADGWLVAPHDSPLGTLTADDVEEIVEQGIAEARRVRAAIRLTPDGRPGARTRMVFAVADTDGQLLGLYRMPDATVFSIDVAVAKARNTAYYADPTALVEFDRVDDDDDGEPDLPANVAMSNRTFRFLAEPRYPSGAEGVPPGDFSILRDQLVDGDGTIISGIHDRTAENIGPPLPASYFAGDAASVLGFDAFQLSRNFRDPEFIEHQNGVVFFPGSTPLYKTRLLVGGFGVSGDGVDQDDVVTAAGQSGYDPPDDLFADQYFVRGVRLPYQKFLRNPLG